MEASREMRSSRAASIMVAIYYLNTIEYQNVQVLQKFPFPSVNKSQGNGTHYAETCILETKMIKQL
jgi:hypothetical protein